MASREDSQTLEYTPTWVVSLVCAIIVMISLFAERFLHFLGKFLKHQNQDSLFRALEKLKEELMLLGFVSLLLAVFQSFINDICIPESVSLHMFPCKKEGSTLVEVVHYLVFVGPIGRRQRNLSGSTGADHCTSQGKVQLLSLEVLHQLHIFIFVLAVVHVVFCATTMVLGGARVSQWKRWEKEIQTEIPEKSSATDFRRHFHPHQDFLQERASGFWRKTAIVSRMISFFKQFYGSVTKSDYRALRAGFIMRHCQTIPHFDFHKYMIRALEDDFKKVVGISWYLWLFVFIFLVINVNGWHAYFWLSFLPLILLLIVGAKLEHIITRLAMDVAQTPTDGQGGPVKPSDELFWLKEPNLVFYLIHFILFQNSFEIAFLFWILCTYGFRSCILEGVRYFVPRLVVGVIVEVLCSYSTLPLYAIVTQMGDSYKQAIFDQYLQSTLHGWAEDVRKRKKSPQSFSAVMDVFGKKRRKQSSSRDGLQTQRMMRTNALEGHLEEIPESEESPHSQIQVV
ncbi:MLO-like protein 13 [Apostasia shenzhenica]|uniref:MLO-like protein n=1 Tax=Apostasia shenzhenica TaxID=1088818 RepID=A0A2I0B3Q3_9ASPA|nr:MLO-like protein 13 [Apostasia shenzhenica]